MGKLVRSEPWGVALFLLVSLCFGTGSAAAAGKRYIVTNDDQAPKVISTASFYTMSAGGQLTLKATVKTGGEGISGGFFGENRLQMLNDGKSQCVYAAEASSGSVVGINVATLKIGGAATGSSGDTGFSNGMGLAMNPQYLYASFSDSNTIGTFQVKPGCKLTFIGDILVGGLLGGTINAMAIHGDLMVATYTDGSIESFDVSAGTPVSNGDEQKSTGSRGGSTYPGGIDISQDGHFAIFGDTSSTTVVEVSDISSGKLTPTIVYHLGPVRSSNNVMLSPDETLLYISNTQGDRITAAFFDKSTGIITKGCASTRLRGYSIDWSYLGSLALQNHQGTGDTLYVAEFGAPSSIGVVKVTSTGSTCVMKEIAKSPVADSSSSGLLTIGSFPPRAF